MNLKVLMSIILVGVLSGCATTKKASPTSHLQIRITSIESQLDDQDLSISELRASVVDLSNAVKHMTAVRQQAGQTTKTVKASAPKTTAQSKYQNILRVPVAPQQVQEALKAAGYYLGSIDGKLGPQSEKAIKEFQVDHDLASDGIVGRKTWTELKIYLD